MKDLGAITLAFLQDWDWIERRVESVTFPDEVTVQRRVSVDFAVPEGWVSPLPLGHDGLPTFFTPLAFLRKQDLIRFDLRDESDHALPLLTREHNGQLAKATLVQLAEAIHTNRGSPLAGKFPSEIGKEVALLATNPSESALVIWDALDRAKSAEESEYCRAWRRFLTVEDKFMTLARDFAVGFPLIVPVTGPVGTRRIVKFSYQASAPSRRSSSPSRQVSRSFGWRPRTERIEVPSIAQARCFHLEVQAPEGLQITRGMLSSSVKPKPTTWQRPLPDIIKSGSERVHMHINAPRTATGRAYVNLRARPSTISRAALSTAVLTMIALVMACLRYEVAQANVGAAVSLLLLVPTALSIYVARPREPIVTTGLLLGQRVLAVCCGILAIAASAVLVVGQDCRTTTLGTTCQPWDTVPWFLGAFAVGAAVLTAILSATAFFTSYPPEKAGLAR